MNCPNCQTELPAHARFCLNCGQPVGAATPADDARLTHLAAAAPAPLAAKMRVARLAGERRVVTALFADVVGSTALAGQMDAEDWTTVMNGAFDRFSPVIYRYEGTIARLLGDALLAFFGAPVAHEDDPVRAVHAALDLLAAARDYAAEVRRDYGVEFAIRVGLNTGLVIVGDVGSDLRYEYTAMGEAVNLAARMQSAARPMTALVSEHTQRFIAPVFDCADLGLLEVKGKAEPVRVYEVRGPKAAPGRLRGLVGLESPLVGRVTELTALGQLTTALQAGRGGVAVVIGEPGLGKTRLIAEWRSQTPKPQAQPPNRQSAICHPPSAIRWVEGHCLSYGQGLAYHLLLDLLRSLLGVSPAASPAETHAALLTLVHDLFDDSTPHPQSAILDVYPYLGHLLGLPLAGEALDRVKSLDPQALQARYLAALRRLLTALAARSPLVLVLEDIHWADPSSTESLIKLLPLADEAPVLFCIVTRPDPDAPGWPLVTTARETWGRRLTELTLTPLSAADSRQLVANLLEIEDLPEQTRALILQKAEGNPFFVEEVIRMLLDRGAIIRRDERWVVGHEVATVEIPDTLQGLLLARIDRLPDDVKHTLRVASVIGRRFPVRVLEQVLGT